jgi:alkylation response protein AidB-like acyl-CoA dehydrogenase
VDRAVIHRCVAGQAVYGADHEAFRDSVQRFLAAEAMPHYADWDAKGAIPTTFWSVAAEYGFVGLSEAGDPRFAAVALEEAMAAGLPAVALALITHDGFALPLLGDRPAEGLVAVVEGGIRAEARDGGWVLSGNAETVLNGLNATLLLVVAHTDEESPSLPGAPVVLAVAGTATGVHRTATPALLGLDALDVADVRLDAVFVAAGNCVIGSPDAAHSPTAATLAAARASHQLALAVAAMAGARTALAMTAEYVQQRKAFGRPIAEFENTQHMLAAVGARVMAVGSFVDSCLANGAAPQPETTAAAAFCAAEVLGSAVDTGVQLHGGYGYMWEYPIARAYAAARYFRLCVGA